MLGNMWQDSGQQQTNRDAVDADKALSGCSCKSLLEIAFHGTPGPFVKGKKEKQAGVYIQVAMYDIAKDIC